METFGESKREWLAQFLDLSNGTPSDDPFRRVISRLDPTAFEDRFRRWTAAVKRRIEQEDEKQADARNEDSSSSSEAEVIALDGKPLRGSADRDKSTLAVVEATRSESTWDEETEQWSWEETTERRYYISSLSPSAERIGTAVRSHWGIENRVHWALDVSFQEDSSRIRKENAPETIGLLRRIAMEDRKSLKARRKKAGWDERYLEKILGFR